MVEHHKKYGNKVNFIGVNVGVSERLERVEKFVKEKDIKFEVFFDEKKSLMTLFGMSVIPTTIVIDKNGRILYVNEITAENVEKYLDELVK